MNKLIFQDYRKAINIYNQSDKVGVAKYAYPPLVSEIKECIVIVLPGKAYVQSFSLQEFVDFCNKIFNL